MELAGFKAVSEVLRSGVYALVWRGDVVYIGKSKNMLSRIYTHRTMIGKSKLPWMATRGVRFDEVFICPCPIEKLDALEYDMINLYKPKYNTQLKTPTHITAPYELKHGAITLVINKPRPIGVIIERRL